MLLGILLTQFDDPGPEYIPGELQRGLQAFAFLYAPVLASETVHGLAPYPVQSDGVRTHTAIQARLFTLGIGLPSRSPIV
jgi:hypothetical protein